jgi:uncharacterized protein (TIGR03435 family)
MGRSANWGYTRPMRKAICALAVLIAAHSGFAQTFEVASVKAEPTGSEAPRMVAVIGGPGSKDPTRIRFVNFSFRALTQSAYGVAYYQVSGPEWTEQSHYEVLATLPEGATKEELRSMLQNLLAERFKLAIHREEKTMPLYSLTVASGGPKLLKPAPDRDVSETDSNTQGPVKLTRDKDGYPKLPPGVQMAMMSGPAGNVARLRSHNQPIASLVQNLSGQLAAPVRDDTGLIEKYDFTLSWISQAPGQLPPESEDAGPSLFSAVRQQLGLKLIAKKGPVEIIVIDHAEKQPSQN